MSNNLFIDGKFQVSGNSYFNVSQTILKSAWRGDGYPAMIQMGHELTFQWDGSSLYVYVDKTQLGRVNIS